MAAFWAAAGALLLLALVVLLIPLWREQKRNRTRTLSAPLAAVAIVPVSIGLYFAVTTFDAELADEVRQDEFALLEQLADRLASNPDDPDGWVLLGRSYMQLGDYGRARMALDEAWSRIDEPDDTLKLAYAQTLLFTEEGAARSLAGELIDEVLETSPRNETALFFGGVVAVERDQPSLATQRWTALLAANPPPEIAEIVRDQLVALGGRSGNVPPPVAEETGPVIDVEVSVAEEVSLDRFGTNARVYIIARGSDMPMPVAVEQHPLSSLPGSFALSDADAMPGMPVNRSLSEYDEVTVIARISATGQAIEQSGDAYAEATIDPSAGETISLVIDRIVP